MSACQDEVAAGMAGAVLTPEEKAQIELWCGDSPAFMIVRVLKFNRACEELRQLFKASECANDNEMWELAFSLMSVHLNPKVALEQAKTELTQSRFAKANLDKKAVVERILRDRKAAEQRLNADGSGLSGGPG